MRKLIKALATPLGVILFIPFSANSADVVVSSATSTAVDLTGSSLTVTATGSIVPGVNPFTPVYLDQSSGGSITNNGLIQGTAGCPTPPCSSPYEGAISIVGSILTGSIINNGTLINTGANSGVIWLTKRIPADPNEQRPIIQGGISNTGIIRVIPLGSQNQHGITLNSGSLGRIEQGIQNSGLIEINGAGVFSSVVRLNGGTAISGGITNSGTMTSNKRAISGGGSIDFITNSGTISGDLDAINTNYFAASPGSIGVITNTGILRSSSGFSINNNPQFRINELKNYQGVSGSGGSPLTYTGALPSLYNIITSGSNYGQLSATTVAAPSPVTSTMTFGIDSSSSLQASTYQSVISGVSAALLNPASFSGSFGPYSWSLLETTPGSETWNLFVSSNYINSGGIYPASNIGVNFNPIFAGGTLEMNQANAAYSQNFTVNNSATNTIDQYGNSSTFSGVFSDATGQTGNLIIANTLTGGKVIFAADNSYTGTTTINSGATLQLGNGGTAGSVAGDIVNNGSLIFERSNDTSYAGVMSGTGSLAKLGVGALTLSGTNTYSGGTTVSAGSLIGDTTSLQGAIANNAAVSFNQATDGTYAGVMSGTGSLTKLGVGALTLSGANSYSGGTTVTAGSLIGNTTSLQGAITNNAAVSFDQATDGTYAGVMSGAGSMTKSGGGKLNMTGVNTYSGPTTVSEGILAANGSLASAVTVEAGAALQGSGSFGGGSVNAGAFLAPGNSIGTITSNGNLTLASGSTYAVEVDAAGNSDKTVVNGVATLQGGTVTVSGSLPSTPVALSKTRYTILTATNGVSGKFASVSGLPSFSFLTGGLTYGANDVTLGYSFATPFSLAAKNINQRNVGNALTLAALGPVNALGAPILNALFLGNYANAQAVMDTVSGSGLAGVQSTAMQVGQMASSAVSDQIAFWRSGETQDATGITSQEGNNPRNYMAYAPVGANVAAKGPIRLNTKGDLVAAVAPRTFRAWGSMFGGGANFQTDAGRGAAASTAGFYGGLMGLDYQLTPNLLVGVALGGSSASFSVGSLSTTGALTGFHAGLYGAYTMGASYVALNETFSAWDNQTSRKAGGYATLPYEQLTAGFGSTEFRTRLEAGHGVPVAGIKATPFIAAEIAAYQTNGFTERSSAVASSFALRNNGQAINSLPTFVGVRLSDAFTLANGWRLAPVGSVAYVHEFFPQRQFTNILLSMPGAEFNVSGPRSTFNLVQTKLGAQLNLTNQLALYSDFQGEFSYVSQSYGGKAGMKYWW